ncbi:THO complex subunit 4 [Babesia bigemina]|uniref:THO complex subunit 4 n=1 Tax=Babesia bigemina TaxID=5866 RepID=A0A061D131_BABBI|nr:THO complex subunit 4 [Babesia bigemina]CDR93802.1 THO complex subunit 4 [Babesia bigemina]|eukprot:XP_012765988.1 THO complex subunit 4 [Babesia bigemina]
MASNSEVRTSQLLDMALDDVDKVLRRGKGTHKGGRTASRYPEAHNDYQPARNMPRNVRGGHREPMQSYGFSKNSCHEQTPSYGDHRGNFHGQMQPYGDARNDLRGQSQPFGDTRNHFQGQMQSYGDGRNDFREHRSDNREHRGGGYYPRQQYSGPDAPRRERFYPQNYGARPLHVTPYGPSSNEPRPPKFIVRVTNLDHNVSHEQLTRLFASVGEVDKVWIDYDRTARSRGTGGCVFKSMSDAKFAISKYDGIDLSGRPISVYGEYQDIPRQRPRPQNVNRNTNNVKSPW